MGGQHLGEAQAREGRLAGDQAIEGGAQAVDVGGRGHVVRIAGLLGGHVGRGADDAAGGGAVAVAQQGASDAEIGHLDAVLGAEQQVRRLDVAVDDAQAMRGGETAGGLQDVGCGLLPRDGAALGHDLLQVIAGDVLHDQEAVAALVAGVQDAHDVLVLDLGGQAGLGQETGAVAAPAHHFDRHVDVQDRMVAEVDPAHAAFADQVGDAHPAQGAGHVLVVVVLAGRPQEVGTGPAADRGLFQQWDGRGLFGLLSNPRQFFTRERARS